VRVTAVRRREMMDATLTQAEFKRHDSGLVSKTLAPTRKSARAGLATDEVKGVVMVGGSTRIAVIRRPSRFFQTDAVDQPRSRQGGRRSAQPCRQNVLAGNRAGDDWLLLDVIPLSLGLETMGGLTEKVIPRATHHSRMPARRTSPPSRMARLR